MLGSPMRSVLYSQALIDEYPIMNKQMRFGRRVALPSTRQIVHEMRMLEAEENRKKASSREAAVNIQVANAEGTAILN